MLFLYIKNSLSITLNHLDPFFHFLSITHMANNAHPSNAPTQAQETTTTVVQHSHAQAQGL
jgi:hypothetical protein